MSLRHKLIDYVANQTPNSDLNNINGKNTLNRVTLSNATIHKGFILYTVHLPPPPMTLGAQLGLYAPVGSPMANWGRDQTKRSSPDPL